MGSYFVRMKRNTPRKLFQMLPGLQDPYKIKKMCFCWIAGLGGSDKNIYQSEGVPRTGYFILAHVGTGAGQIWASFRRRRPAKFSKVGNPRK